MIRDCLQTVARFAVVLPSFTQRNALKNRLRLSHDLDRRHTSARSASTASPASASPAAASATDC